jgi:hypothetical protein
MTDINSQTNFIENGQLYINLSPTSIINEEIRKRNIKTNRQYREYLQTNAPTIMVYNFETVPQVLGNAIPYLFNGVNDNSRPNGYETSEAKQRFLSEQSVFANQTRPMLSNYM